MITTRAPDGANKIGRFDVNPNVISNGSSLLPTFALSNKSESESQNVHNLIQPLRNLQNHSAPFLDQILKFDNIFNHLSFTFFEVTLYVTEDVN